ncbi:MULTISPECIES: methyltransferase domain-containing protein [unclassified Nonomuraea]|uniref:methyltransferase domain-containing protein n=1 Tax=unclassified Nonomuraea TaxID=2593643 RepID=UPI00207BC60C|nr:methyltransferase domain-containing protein [Nonomuraea sp. KC401]
MQTFLRAAGARMRPAAHAFAVARAVRGIEPLVATEIQRSSLGRVRGLRHREVWFEPSPEADLLGLRTADDVLIAAAVVDGVGHDRSALPRLAGAARDLHPVLPAWPDAGGLEVSASFVGRRNYTRYEIEDAVGAELARPSGLAYHSRRDGRRPPPDALSWRVTIEGDQAVIALRLADRPLHRRPYKTASVRGTLHPPVAAAMARLARLGDARTVLDPCCGAGTTLIEANALAPRLRPAGFDHDPAAIAAAAANARTAGASPFLWGVGDAGRLPVADGCVDRVLVNPPWGRQVPPRGALARGLGPLWREVRRVLADDGLAVALVHDGIPSGFVVEETHQVSLSGRHPEIAVLRKARSRG